MKTLVIFSTLLAVVMMEPTIRPFSPFNPEADANALKTAMAGIVSIDKKAIINIVGKRNNNQRLQIAAKYKTMFGKDIIEKFKDKLTGHLEDTVVAAFTPIPIFFAKELNDAMAGAGTEERILIEILASFNNVWIRKIREAYQAKYSRSLEADIKDDTSGSFRKILVSLVQGNRDESPTVNQANVRSDAQALFDAGAHLINKDDSAFNRIMTTRSYLHLRKVFEHYKTISSGKNFEDAIKDQFSGDTKEALMAVVRCITDSSTYYAKQLYKAMDGVGTTDKTLIRIIVTGSEFDHLALAKRAYVAKYGKTLQRDIEGETSGEYKDLLLMLVGPN